MLNTVPVRNLWIPSFQMKSYTFSIPVPRETKKEALPLIKVPWSYLIAMKCIRPSAEVAKYLGWER